VRFLKDSLTGETVGNLGKWDGKKKAGQWRGVGNGDAPLMEEIKTRMGSDHTVPTIASVISTGVSIGNGPHSFNSRMINWRRRGNLRPAYGAGACWGL
jgi:hypothetical protein